ncbi:glycerol-3-phosphate phosphatase-like [Sitodiplosis mosellana]|uniref:glycerol-3-phosphate phosphatase-like n=1 Tax=Sitodiplosis mosellana TaxID=263140 RepID=UPI0024439276|nr:glycerol-3-phosphate phosphatase-like [Sitodiplosis mosellana]
MFKQTATNLTTLPRQSIDAWIDSFDTVLSDCDGVQWIGRELVAGSLEVTKRLQELGKKVFFVTNMPVKTRAELQAAGVDRGYEVEQEEILSASYVTAKYLHDLKFDKKVYLIGSRGISQEFDHFGISWIDSDCSEKVDVLDAVSNGIKLDSEVGAVVVSFDTNINYSKILLAANYIKDPECLFIGTSFDEAYPTNNGAIVPGTGPNISAIEVASGRKATIIGKPNPNMCKSLLAGGKINPERTLMIGDSVKYDILFGFNCGFQTLLVGTGVNKLEEVRKWQKSNIEDDKKLIPDTYLPALGDLLPFLQ